MSKKTRRLFLRIIAGTFILLLLLLLSLRIPYIQTEIAHFAAGKLSKQLGTHVSIDKVTMNFIDNANFKGIYIEDRNQDTLAYSEAINIDISFFKLFKKQIVIDQIAMKRGIVNISQTKDSLYNFQFILDAFSSTDTATSEAPIFLVNLDKIKLKDVQARADLLAGMHQLYFEDLYIDVKMLDIENQEVVIDEIIIDGLNTKSVLNKTLDQEENSADESESSEFPLSEIPYEIDLKKIRINKANIAILEKGYSPSKTFDPRFVDLKQLQVDLDELSISKSKLEGQVSNLSVNINQQIELTKLSSDVLFTAQTLALKDLSISTLGSTGSGKILAKYDSFNDLINLNKSVNIDVNIPALDLSVNNIAYFFPSESLAPFKNDVLRMNLVAKGSVENLDLNQFYLKVGHTLINAKGKITKPLEIDQLRLIDFKIDGKADYEEYASFITSDTLKKQLKEIGDIQIKGSVNGSMDSMNIQNLEIYTDALAQAKVSGHLTRIRDLESLSYNLRVDHLTSGSNDARIFLDSLPEIVEKFDTIRYAGKARGNLYDVEVDGKFLTSLGNADTDFRVNFNKDYSDASYEGLIELQDFDLKTLMDNDSLDRVSMTLDLSGSGMTPENLKTSIKASISEIGI